MHWHDCCQKWQQKCCQCIRQGPAASAVDWWIQEKALTWFISKNNWDFLTSALVKAAKEGLLQTCLAGSGLVRSAQQQWVGFGQSSLCSCEPAAPAVCMMVHLCINTNVSLAETFQPFALTQKYFWEGESFLQYC